MTPFQLKIVTPDGLIYDGMAEELIVRSTSGDIGVMAGHINCVVPLGMGQAMAIIDGTKKYAACIGGMLSVLDGKLTLVPTTFEWADKIDLKRAEASYDRASKALKQENATDTEIALAQARMHRALVRKSVVNDK